MARTSRAWCPSGEFPRYIPFGISPRLIFVHFSSRTFVFSSNDEDVPPPLPPHGIPAGEAFGNGSEDYKPPVPPHRKTGFVARLPETPKKHHHRPSSGSHGNHRHSKHHGKSQKLQNGSAGLEQQQQQRDKNASRDNADDEFVELRQEEEERRSGMKDKSKEVKRATIVGNPMYSSQEQEEMALDDLNLGMDYDQIMQYFDNLKESNA